MYAKRLLLMGDSIIDNGAYVQPGEPDVAEQVRKLMPEFDVEKRAIDGSVTADVTRAQLHELQDTDLIVLSTGGNDALLRADLLDNVIHSESKSILVELWNVRETFRSDYAALLSKLAQKNRRILVFTIYNPNFATAGNDADYQKAAESGVSAFNDVIQQEALARNCSILELRAFFDAPSDYANPIEPSAAGGAKLAERIRAWALPE